MGLFVAIFYPKEGEGGEGGCGPGQRDQLLLHLPQHQDHREIVQTLDGTLEIYIWIGCLSLSAGLQLKGLRLNAAAASAMAAHVFPLT